MINHWPEKSFEIFRKLGSSGVPGIHGDEQTDSRNQVYLFSQEVEPFPFLLDRVLYTFDLKVLLIVTISNIVD